MNWYLTIPLQLAPLAPNNVKVKSIFFNFHSRYFYWRGRQERIYLIYSTAMSRRIQYVWVQLQFIHGSRFETIARKKKSGLSARLLSLVKQNKAILISSFDVNFCCFRDWYKCGLTMYEILLFHYSKRTRPTRHAMKLKHSVFYQ